MNTEVKPTLPCIHMNGTAASDLLEGYRNAMEKVQDAREALGKIEFNMRDYYPIEGSWDKAQSEMQERYQALDKIHAELEAIAIHCCDHVK